MRRDAGFGGNFREAAADHVERGSVDVFEHAEAGHGAPLIDGVESAGV